MCGIVGIWDMSGSPVFSDHVSNMVKSLAHRGPDAQGVWSGGPICLGHSRLSIIDLSEKGAQPFVSVDGRYVLVFNGEIYNYKELIQEYFSEEEFYSHSDTEVLLKMLIRFKEDALPKLRGMFAFALFDTQEQALLLACDPFGKKPLYYAWINDTLLFASEPKALFASGFVLPSIREYSIEQYLQEEYVRQPQTAYIGVLALTGGQCMRVTKQGTSIATWWRPQITPKQSISFISAARQFDDLLGQAVERRMVADVPVGIFLSGGLDSSAIAWYMKKVAAHAEIHSCSVSFEDSSFNEAQYANMVAHSIGTIHHTMEFSYDVFLSTLQEIVRVIDVPFADSSLLPTYAVSKLARQYMTVVLGGDGADELLGGYGTFDAYEMHAKASWVPSGVWRGLETLVENALPVSHRYFAFDFKLKSFLRGAQYKNPQNLAVWLGAFTSKEVQSLVKHPLAPLPIYYSGAYLGNGNTFDLATLLHLKGYLANDILVKFDRATMAASLEARTPFLDVDLAEFVLRLPANYKKHKRILRHVMAGRLPNEILTRKKQGFGIPIGRWLMREKSIARQVLSQARIESSGIFVYSAINNLLIAHELGKKDYRKKIWALIMFQLWYEYWIMEKRDIL